MLKWLAALLAPVVGFVGLTSCRGPDNPSVVAPAGASTARVPAATTVTTATTTVPAPSTGTRVPAGPVLLTRIELNLVDHRRPTVSRGRRLASSRALTTTVWFPTGPATRRPLVVFAHGYSVGVAPYVRICQAWARAGFVVAAPSFPLTDRTVAGPALDEKDMVNQPGDVSFVISALLASSATPAAPLGGMIDPQRIAVAGHSDGADTALAVTYLPGDRDARIRAAIVDAPDPLPLAVGAPKLTSNVPLLLVHGDHDTIAPFSGSQRVLAQLTTPGWFLILQGADHLAPIQGSTPWTPTLDRVSTDFLANVFDNYAALNTTLVADVAGAPAPLHAIG